MKRPRRSLSPFRVDGSLDRPQNAGNRLPLVEQHRLNKPAQSSVGISLERRRLDRPVQAYRGGGIAQGGRRLARRAGPRQEHGGNFVQQARYQRIHQPIAIIAHTPTLPAEPRSGAAPNRRSCWDADA